MFPGLPPIAAAMIGLDGDPAIVAGAGSSGERARAVIAWLAGSGARAIRLDGTMAGIRARELDRSGRRDLASVLRRAEIEFAGVDAFVPPEHFVSVGMVDRAVAAVLSVIDLAADLAALRAGSVTSRGGSRGAAGVSVTLPEKLPADIRRTIEDRAVSRGVRIADHAWPIGEDAGEEATSAIGVGLDPATVLGAGQDPIGLAARLGGRVACARLSDLGKGAGAGGGGLGGGRVIPGSGRLDVGAYLASLGATGYVGHAVLDLRGLGDPGAAIRETMRRVAMAPGA